MRKSIDIVQHKTLKNIVPYNLEEEEENEEEQDNNFTSLSRVYTSNNISYKGDPIKYNACKTSNPSLYRIQKDNTNFHESKTENNSDRNNLVKYTKKSNINKFKIDKGSMRMINGNNKIVYIRKRNNDVKDKKVNTSKNTIDKDITQDNESEMNEKEMIKEIKDSVICYICLMKIEKPRICPNCHRIACEKCLKNWFIDKGNNTCGYCRTVLTFDKMISIPIINNVANLIDKISSKAKNKKIGAHFTSLKKARHSNYDLSNNIINEENTDFNEDDIAINSRNNDFLSKKFNTKQSIYLNKKENITSYSTHEPYIRYENKNQSLPLIPTEEYCPKHNDQPLFYYCIDCKQAYCRTCFVFFGEEKDKHIKHNIIEYSKYKTTNIPQIIKNANNLDYKYEEIDAYVKRCEALKNCYEFERALVEEQVKLLMDNYNATMNENIKTLDNIIKKYKAYLDQINECKKDIKEFYISQKYEPDEIIEKINDINKIKYYKSKEIDNYSDLSKKMVLNVFQTKLKKCEIKQSNYHFKIPLDGSKYQLAITQKVNELQIYIYWPEDKETNDEKEKYINLLPIIFLRKKNKNWESFKLNEFLKYKGNQYYIKRFSTNNFCNPNSYFKIKGIMYENYIE